MNSSEGKSYQQRVTLKEMARILHRCEKTFRKYVGEYKIPHIRLGRDMLFNVAEVENHLRNFTITTQNIEPVKNSSGARSKSKRTLTNSDKSKNRYANLLGLS